MKIVSSERFIAWGISKYNYIGIHRITVYQQFCTKVSLALLQKKQDLFQYECIRVYLCWDLIGSSGEPLRRTALLLAGSLHLFFSVTSQVRAEQLINVQEIKLETVLGLVWNLGEGSIIKFVTIRGKWLL